MSKPINLPWAVDEQVAMEQPMPAALVRGRGPERGTPSIRRRCRPKTAIRGERPEIQFSSRKPRANKGLAHHGKSFMVAPNDLAFQTTGLGARSGFAIC